MESDASRKTILRPISSHRLALVQVSYQIRRMLHSKHLCMCQEARRCVKCEREHLSLILPCWQPQNVRPMKLRLFYHYNCRTCKAERFRRKGELELTSRRPTVRRPSYSLDQHPGPNYLQWSLYRAVGDDMTGFGAGGGLADGEGAGPSCGEVRARPHNLIGRWPSY